MTSINIIAGTGVQAVRNSIEIWVISKQKSFDANTGSRIKGLILL